MLEVGGGEAVSLICCWNGECQIKIGTFLSWKTSVTNYAQAKIDRFLKWTVFQGKFWHQNGQKIVAKVGNTV